LEQAIKAAQKQNMWVILTCRAAQAAGDGYPNDVFHDNKLKWEFLEMWKWVANRYKDWEWIAGYEIMSEPRTKITPDTEVARFFSDAIAAIRTKDTETPCIIGPAPYYKVMKLNKAYLQNDLKVIYTFDFFLPTDYAQDTEQDKYYPSTYACNDIFSGWVS